MKVPGSIYIGKHGRKYLALYNYFPDIYRAAPPSIPDLKYITHVAYTAGRASRGIDVFLLNGDMSKSYLKKIEKEVNIKRLIPFLTDDISYVDKKYDVKYKILTGFNQEQEIKQEVLTAARKDIRDYFKDKREAKILTGTKIDCVKEISPEFKIRKIKQKRLLQGGKQEFVPSCSLEANLDFSWGCISGFVNGFLDVFAECNYCYSLYQHKTFWKYIIDFSKKQLKNELLGDCYLSSTRSERLGKPVDVLRLGKRTEAGSQFTLDSLVLTLETCAETGTRVVMPTKYLRFDKEIAELFKKTKSSVPYSVSGHDELEKGACSHGCSNDFRLEQARLYREKGVNSIIYLLIDLPHEPHERELNVLKFAKKNKIPVQLLPIRIPNKEIAKKITGMSWEDLKLKGSYEQLSFSGVPSVQIGGYIYAGGGMMTAQEKDPFWLGLIKNNKKNIRMCHHDEQETYCGNCFLDKGFITQTEEVKIIYQKFRRGNWKWGKKRKNKDIGGELPFDGI